MSEKGAKMRRCFSFSFRFTSLSSGHGSGRILIVSAVKSPHPGRCTFCPMFMLAPCRYP